MTRHLAAWLAILWAVTVAPAQDPPVDPAAPVILAPRRVFTYPAGTTIRSIRLAPDGDLVAHFDVGAVDLAARLVSVWPEAVAAAVTLLLLALILRIARRPQVAGRPHCRRCNYLLLGSTAERCSECGRDLHRRGRVQGRSRRGRVALPLFLLAVAGLGYGLGDDLLPRRLAGRGLLRWHSPGLYDWALRKGHTWLYERSVFLTRVVRIDPATGDVTRMLLERVGRASDMHVTADGRTFVLAWFDGVTQHDLDTGATIARLDLPGASAVSFDIESTADGGTILLALGSNAILAWEPSRDRVETFPDVFALGPRTIARSVSMQRLVPSGRIAIIDLWPHHFGYREWDPRGRGFVHAFQAPTPEGASAVVPTPDGARVYASEFPSLSVYAPTTGAFVEALDVPAQPLHAVAIDGEQRLFAACFRMTQALYVVDLATRQWPIALRSPGTSPPIHGDGFVMPDARTVITAGRSRRRPPNDGWSILVFDLGEGGEAD